MFDWVLNTSLLESPIKVKQGNSGSKKSDVTIPKLLKVFVW